MTTPTDRSIVKAFFAGLLRTASTSTQIVDPVGAASVMSTRTQHMSRVGSENAATNVAETAGCVVNRASVLKSIKLTSATAVTNSNTDHLVVYAYKYTSAGGSKTLLGSWNTATAAQSATTAFAAHSLSLVGGTANNIAAGSTISYHVGKFNQGQALANLALAVDLEEV
jgi:ABC-type hemin transport system substrate-binding protein